MRRTARAALLLLLSLGAAGGLCTAHAGEEKGVKILATNDVHGNIYGDPAAKRIGYASLRGYADALEKEGWTVYLVDAGDAFSGNAVAQSDSGKSVANLMKTAGYSVVTPGNHAFDYNQSERNERYYSDVLLPMTGAKAVSANVLFRGGALPGASREPVLLHEEPGLRVLVTGATTPYVASMTNRQGVRNYDFGLVTDADGKADHAATKARVLAAVADAAAPYDAPEDVVILLSHLGGDDTPDYADGQITGRDAALVPNVDIVIDAHSHNLVEPQRIGDAWYALASRYMTHVAEITIPKGGEPALAVLPYEAFSAYPASQAVLAGTRAIADSLGMGDRVFELGGEVDLSDAGISEISTPLGRFICRVMTEITGADFALFNAGGIRSGLKPGWVTVGDIYDMTPFQNNLQTFRLTGREVLDLFRPLPQTRTNAFPQFYGVTAYAWEDGEDSLAVAGVLDGDGLPVDPDGEYTFATINFLAEGGDGYHFPVDGLVDDAGDFFTRFARHLRENGLGDPEELKGNDGILVFSDRAAAQEAFDADAAANAEAALFADEDGDGDALLFADVAGRFRDHCVRVFLRAQSHEGELPEVGTFAEDIRGERPTLLGGYWWDGRHVVLHDPVLHDVFIRSIEVATPGSDKRYPARVAGHFTRMDALLLEVLPDAAGELPEAHPLVFVDGGIDEAQTMLYGWENGKWRLTLESGIGVSRLTDEGEETADLSANGVFINDDGDTVGLSFGETILLDGETPAWLGTETPDAPLLPVEDAEALRGALSGRLASGVLETVFRLRLVVDDEDGEDSLRAFEDLLAPGSAVLRAPGLVVGKDVLLVPVALPQEGIARIDSIAVMTADGREIPARFVGAFRDYMALLIAAEAPLPFANVPEGFALLNPLLPPDEIPAPYPLPEGELIHRLRVDYALGRRREKADYDRWTGAFPGYRGDPLVATRTNEAEASLAFDGEGRLAAFALAPRLPRSVADEGTAAAAAFRPVDFLSAKLRAADAFDSALHPVDGDRGERLIDFGAEFQPLDPNTARLFHVVRETRAGDIGLLVTHVYPGSLADGAGVREHDVLLRMTVEGRGEPVELRSGAVLFGGGEYDPDMSPEMFARLIRFMPPPWPSRENPLSALLTGAGAGRKVALEYMREGAPRRVEFMTRFFDTDYRSAEKKKFDALGLTAKPLTYEVARFFAKTPGTAVVVSDVEEGGRAAVAGLRGCARSRTAPRAPWN